MVVATGNKVIIEVFDKRHISKGGIELPVTKNNSFVPFMGILISKGNAVDIDVPIGSKVIFEKYVGDVVDYDGRKFLSLHQSHVLAILPDTYDVSTYEEDKASY